MLATLAATWPPHGEAPGGRARVCPCCIQGYCSPRAWQKQALERIARKTQNLLTKSTLERTVLRMQPFLSPIPFCQPWHRRQPEAPRQMVPGWACGRRAWRAGSSFWARPKAGTSGNKRGAAAAKDGLTLEGILQSPCIWGHRGQQQRSRLLSPQGQRGGWGLASRPGSSPWPCSAGRRPLAPQLVRESVAYFRGSGGPEDTSCGGRLGARARQHFLCNADFITSQPVTLDKSLQLLRLLPPL